MERAAGVPLLAALHSTGPVANGAITGRSPQLTRSSEIERGDYPFGEGCLRISLDNW